MSGGSYNYLYCKKTSELFDYYNTGLLEDMSDAARQQGAEDIARDIMRLVEYIKSAHIRVETLQEQLRDVLKAIEWRESCDIGDESLQKVFEEYRRK